ncbi:hypothetical protein IDH21_04080 [Pelagibacterales bacterium SAG-MED47]|nr:hypothetical protein [Pelagibacterales bacterium SAG-MED47]
MFKFFFPYLKTFFYISNFILIVLYLFPGSILGYFIYGNLALQPQITSDFIVSSNHVYAFMALTFLGYISYDNQRLTFIFSYLFLISIFLELLHFIIPNRGFEFSDLFGNILGVLCIYIFYQLKKFINNSKNEKKELK